MELVAEVQGFYFLITGVWPIVSIGSFQAVTGPKRDLWLVKTVGLVLAVVGGSLIPAGYRGEVALPTLVLAMGTAAGLGAVDVIYAAKKVISPVYFLDAAVELVLVVWWLISLV